MSARLALAFAVLPLVAATAPPAAAIATVVGPRCALYDGRPGVDTAGAGLLTAGPLVPTQEAAIRVTVTCTVQEGSATPYTEERVRASRTLPGTAGALAHATTAVPGGPAYVCTYVTWTLPSGSSRSWTNDADPSTPGPQCPAAD